MLLVVSMRSAHPARMATMASLPAISSPNSSADSDALAVHPDHRSSAASQTASHSSGLMPSAMASCSASQAVRREWSVGCPILRSQTNASALATSKARRVEFSSCTILVKLLVPEADSSWLLRLVQPKAAFDSRARSGENFVGALLVAFETCKRERAEQLSKRGARIGHGFGAPDRLQQRRE